MIDFGMVLGLRGGNIGPFWGDFRSNFDRMLAAISCSAFALLGPRFASLVLAFLPFRLACSSKVRGDRAGKPGEKPQANARNTPSSTRPAQAAQRPSKGIRDRIGLLVRCSRCSCRSCLAARPGARALAFAVLAALAALAVLGVLAALAAHALPVP